VFERAVIGLAQRSRNPVPAQVLQERITRRLCVLHDRCEGQQRRCDEDPQGDP
jgi:hypothetical protein